MVRFGHEMNGSWYPWAQQPTAYIETFRQVAAAVHNAPASSMLWSPNEGGGYPFEGGPNDVQPGSPDFQSLDTNHDGKLTMDDDTYAPCWPGDDSVDWVGLTVYHFANAYPWGRTPSRNRGSSPQKFRGRTRATTSTKQPCLISTPPTQPGTTNRSRSPKREPSTTPRAATAHRPWQSRKPGGTSSSTPGCRPDSRSSNSPSGSNSPNRKTSPEVP